VSAVHQVLPSFARPDAIGAHTLRVQRILRSAGIESEIFALHFSEDVRKLARDARTLPDLPCRNDAWFIYQFSIGSEVLDQVRELGLTFGINYHNITEARHFWRWEPRAAATMLQGRRQLASVANIAAFGIAVSHFNERELHAAGFIRTKVAPLLIDFADFDIDPDPTVLSNRRRRRDAGGVDWLCVGRIAPNKCQHDVIASFAAYRRFFDPKARLTFIGGQSVGSYWHALHELAAELGIADAVVFTDVVSDAELLACYRTSDVLVCLSDHEGFNAPVVEAMYFGVPVVAYASSALPETIADAGLLLDQKDPLFVAGAINRVLTDAAFRETLVRAGQRRAHDFAIERTGPMMLDAILEMTSEARS